MAPVKPSVVGEERQELTNRVIEHHTDTFWNAVGAHVPDYEARREWLRPNGNTLVL